MSVAKSDLENYEEIKKEYEKHHNHANHEHVHYNNNIEKSKADSSFLYICYNWAQNVSIPYSPQQVGSIYFKVPFAVNIFGVCKMGKKNQLTEEVETHLEALEVAEDWHKNKSYWIGLSTQKRKISN